MAHILSLLHLNGGVFKSLDGPVYALALLVNRKSQGPGWKNCTLASQSPKSAENLLKCHHVGEEIKVLEEEISFRSSEGCLLEISEVSWKLRLVFI